MMTGWAYTAIYEVWPRVLHTRTGLSGYVFAGYGADWMSLLRRGYLDVEIWFPVASLRHLDGQDSPCGAVRAQLQHDLAP